MSDLEDRLEREFRWPGGDPGREALARREALLPRLREEVRRRRESKFRRGARSLLLAAAASILLASAWALRPPPPVERGEPERAAVLVPAPAARRTVEVIATRPGILERYALPKKPLPEGAIIDDDELLGLLTSAHRPAGIVRIGGRAFLTE